MSEQIIPASRKRIFLALYLDYLVLSPVLAVGLYLSTGQFEVPTWQELIVLSIYEAILYHVTDSRLPPPEHQKVWTEYAP